MLCSTGAATSSGRVSIETSGAGSRGTARSGPVAGAGSGAGTPVVARPRPPPVQRPPPPSGGQELRDPEEREEARGVEEEVEPADAPVRRSRRPAATRAVSRRRARACTARSRGEPLASTGKSREPMQPMPGPRHQRPDVVVRLEPQLVRRHGPVRVLLEERGERVHVVSLEGVDVAREQLARLRVGGRADRLDRSAGARASRGRAAARCSPPARSCRAAPRPPRRASAGPRAGSAPRAAVAAGAGARP